MLYTVSDRLGDLDLFRESVLSPVVGLTGTPSVTGAGVKGCGCGGVKGCVSGGVADWGASGVKGSGGCGVTGCLVPTSGASDSGGVCA